jgi:NAD(P)-dependent dehydrogenase (short-subunit alcohol dehydrogenase family)
MSETTPHRLRILLVGARGTLGKAVATELGRRHDIIKAGRGTGDLKLNLTDPAGMVAAMAEMGPVDAVICAAGEVSFSPLAQIRPATIADSVYALGLTNKLLGQVNLALAAREVLRDGGSITLTGGILSDHPIVAGSSASMVNGALEGFVRAAAVEMPRGIRINLVSPSVLVESMDAYGPFFRGFEPVPAARAALAFSRSVEGPQTGQVYRVM